MREQVILSRPERFLEPAQISQEKLNYAIEKALNKLEKDIDRWTEHFAGTSSVNYKYQQGPNNNWVCGMQTGLYWLAYELSGDKKFREVAQKHMSTYQERLDKRIGLNDHDVGFVYTPSCVAAYKLTGDEQIRKMLLEVTDYYYRTSYTKEGGFILRGWSWQDKGGCRTMMDTLMNAPLLFWAGEETGNEEYTVAALSQSRTTEKYLIRQDGSSFHHYQFEPGTFRPVRGLTLQGYSDDSCWSRGHAWGVYGFPLAYSYTKEDFLVNVHRDVTYYMLNHLPDNDIPCWDYVFTEGDRQPSDSSAGVISVCGMHEMCKYLPDDAPQKKIFQNAAAKMLEAVIDQCTGDIGREYDGLICHVSHAVPQRTGIDECAIYGDYFYLEALMRFVNPNWNRYW